MNVSPIQLIFHLASSAVSLYSTFCFIRCLCSWVPSINYSRFGQFLQALCDPWMNLFRRLPLQFLGIDFSAMLSLGALYLISSILESIAQTGAFRISAILAYLVMLLWSVFSTLLGIFLIVLIIRLCVLIFSPSSNYYGSIWTQIDSSLSRAVFKISGAFTGNRSIRYKTALIISIIVLIVSLIAGFYAYYGLNLLISMLPF